MTPTLFGRIQTRLFLLATVGVVWTLLITPLVGAPYGVTYLVLALVAVLGIGWEVVWHGLMQFRWEKDWPAVLILGQAIPEGLLIYALLGRLTSTSMSPLVFWIVFGTTWLWVFLVAHGPMRILTIRWRFRGGRLL